MPCRPSSARCSRHIADFGRYPAGKGTDASAAPPPRGWSAATCRGPVDPDSEILVLNGTREGLFLAAIAAKRFVAHAPASPRS